VPKTMCCNMKYFHHRNNTVILMLSHKVQLFIFFLMKFKVIGGPRSHVSPSVERGLSVRPSVRPHARMAYFSRTLYTAANIFNYFTD
jgi:hypothetical protein